MPPSLNLGTGHYLRRTIYLHLAQRAIEEFAEGRHAEQYDWAGAPRESRAERPKTIYVSVDVARS